MINSWLLDSSVGKGMSGGPVLRDEKLLGVLYARDTDKDAAYFVPLGEFKKFITEHLGDQILISPGDLSGERLTFLKTVKKEIEKQLNRRPLSDLKMALEDDGDFFQILSEIKDDATTNKKYFERFAIQFKDGRTQNRSATLYGGKVLGWEKNTVI